MKLPSLNPSRGLLAATVATCCAAAVAFPPANNGPIINGPVIVGSDVGDGVDENFADHLSNHFVAAETKGTIPGDWYHSATENRTLSGLVTCYRCHSSAVSTDPEILKRLPFAPGQDDWILGSELATWIKCDRHYLAFKVLKNDRAVQMAKRLGVVDPKTGESQIHLDQRCLACHAAFPVNHLDGYLADGADHRLDPAKIDEAMMQTLELGVSCEGCHGPSTGKTDDIKGWNVAHVADPKWRFMDPEKKLEDYGYFDVRSPITKTRICLSCHLGDVSMGKVVTHEMYAAGHPPLPSFEVATFATQEPRHWRLLGEKSEAVRSEFLKRTGKEYEPEQLARTREMLVGAAVALSQSLQLGADLADPPANAPIVTPAWPELTAFACANCHHELRVPSWRQTRDPKTGPGRPRLHEWPEAILRAAVLNKPDADLKQLDAAYDTLRKQPFGNPQQFSKAARSAAAWSETLAEDLSKNQISREQGWQLLAEISTAAAEGQPDYESARQLAWACSIIYDDLSNRRRQVGAFEGWYPHPEGDPLAVALQGLAGPLRLNLTGEAGREEVCPTNTEEIDRPLASSLDPMALYDPLAVRDLFLQVATLARQQSGTNGATKTGAANTDALKLPPDVMIRRAAPK